MKLQLVIDCLIDQAPSLTAVLPLEDLEALGKMTSPRSGTAFVLPYREKGEPNEIATGSFRQLIAFQFLVAFVVRRHDDASGGKKLLTFDVLKEEIEEALAGWVPVRGSAACELVAAQAAPLGNGVSLYVQTWQTSRYLERKR